MRFLAAEACGSDPLRDTYGKIIRILMIFTTETREIVVTDILIDPVSAPLYVMLLRKASVRALNSSAHSILPIWAAFSNTRSCAFGIFGTNASV